MYYLYRCSECGFEETFEYSINETISKVKSCPQCGKKAMKNVITGGSGVIYRANYNFSKSKVDISKAINQTTKIAYNKKALEQYRERNSS
jgi:putative FmdB family regulatory protein